jgi:hypothetical protein
MDHVPPQYQHDGPELHDGRSHTALSRRQICPAAYLKDLRVERARSLIPEFGDVLGQRYERFKETIAPLGGRFSSY